MVGDGDGSLLLTAAAAVSSSRTPTDEPKSGRTDLRNSTSPQDFPVLVAKVLSCPSLELVMVVNLLSPSNFPVLV